MTDGSSAENTGYGCPECWPADAHSAWAATCRLPFEAEVVDAAHFHLRIHVCRVCSQKFLKSFYEEIDWEDGDDPQFFAVVPITPAEEDVIFARGDGDGDFLSVGKDRHVVRKDCPKGDPDGVIRWSFGFRLRPEHE